VLSETLLGEPLRSGEGYSRPELLSLLIARTPTAQVHERAVHAKPVGEHGSQELLTTVA
jgi:nitrilase